MGLSIESEIQANTSHGETLPKSTFFSWFIIFWSFTQFSVSFVFIAINGTIEQLKSEGLSCKGYVVDISKRENVVEAAKIIKDEIGNVDILINNAGIVCCKPFWDLSEKMIENTYAVNILSHYWVNSVIYALDRSWEFIPCPLAYRRPKHSFQRWWNRIVVTLWPLHPWPDCSAHTVAPTTVPRNSPALDSMRQCSPNCAHMATMTSTWHWCVRITLHLACLPASSRACSQCLHRDTSPTRSLCRCRRTKSIAQCHTAFGCWYRWNGEFAQPFDLESDFYYFFCLQFIAGKNVLGAHDSCYQRTTIDDDVQRQRPRSSRIIFNFQFIPWIQL